MRLTLRRRPTYRWQPDHRLVRLLLLILLSKISEPANCLGVLNDDNVIGAASNSSVTTVTTVNVAFETEEPPNPPHSDADDCAPCVCKWSGGKQVAECVGAQLVDVPRGLRAETQVSEHGQQRVPRSPSGMGSVCGQFPLSERARC